MPPFTYVYMSFSCSL
uniref:Uncharacterized protein n=1 Tax=Anguilla anguilla TaxID=7936 RepID=A0A0E9PRA1_ANGAN